MSRQRSQSIKSHGSETANVLPDGAVAVTKEVYADRCIYSLSSEIHLVIDLIETILSLS